MASFPRTESSITDRSQFLSRLGRLSTKDDDDEVLTNGEEDLEVSRLEALRNQGRDTEAFFLARRMAAEGVEGAKEMVTEILGDLNR